MTQKNYCKIIQDLLPNYIENLTNKDTNSYIEEHLEKCENCKKIFENMRKELNFEKTNIDKKEVKYIKKFNNKMKILKTIMLLIFIIFVVINARKIVIISNLSKKAEECIKSTNYHRITYSYDQEKYSKTEIFNLGNKKKIVTTQISNEDITKKEMFTNKISENEYITNIYTETSNDRIAQLNRKFQISAEIQNSLYTENLWQLILSTIPASIKLVTFNGEECYYISNFQNPYAYCSEGMYINKENGLLMSTIAYEYEDSEGIKARWPAAEYVYEFNTVTENDFIEPDINEYKIK